MEPTATGKLEIATPSECEIVMTRVFDAPREMVFDAFTKPELVKRWLLGPDGWSMPVCQIDLKPGGAFHWLWRKDDGSMEFGSSGTFREVSRPVKIVRVEKFDPPMETSEAVITTTFAQSRGATTVTMNMLFVSQEVRDEALESGMERGIIASYDRLADILKHGAA
jgi:uncharacterized protein YndB with AHSA1/START domain